MFALGISAEDSDEEPTSPYVSDGEEEKWVPPSPKMNAREKAALKPYALEKEEAFDESTINDGPAGPEAVAATPQLSAVLTVDMDADVEALSSRFSPDGTMVATGCTDGFIRVYSTADGRRMHQVNATDGVAAEASAVTAMRFRDTAGLDTKNIIMLGTSNGYLRFWHATSGKFLGQPLLEEGNQIYSLDTGEDGRQVASAGLDGAVRVYDVGSTKLVHTLQGGDGVTCGGHTNRIFAVKFVPDQPDVLISGGWDNTVQVWDMRVGNSVRSIYGPHICGEALDIAGTTVYTGSHRRFRALQMWDFGSGQLLADVPWVPAADASACFIFAAQVGHGPTANTLAVGGCGSKEMRWVGANSEGKPLGRMSGLTGAVHGVTFNASGDQLAVTSKDKVQIVGLIG